MLQLTLGERIGYNKAAFSVVFEQTHRKNLHIPQQIVAQMKV
jgi:hypothetical protein